MSDDLNENDSPLEEGALPSGENESAPASQSSEDSLEDLKDLALDPDSIEDLMPKMKSDEPAAAQDDLDSLAEDADPEDLIAAALAANAPAEPESETEPGPAAAQEDLDSLAKDADPEDLIAAALAANALAEPESETEPGPAAAQKDLDSLAEDADPEDLIAAALAANAPAEPVAEPESEPAPEVPAEESAAAQDDLDSLAEDADPENLIAAALAANTPAEPVAEPESEPAPEVPAEEPAAAQDDLDSLAEDADPEDLIAAALAANTPTEPESEPAPATPAEEPKSKEVEVDLADGGLLSQDFLNGALSELESEPEPESETEKPLGEPKSKEVEVDLPDGGLLSQDFLNAALDEMEAPDSEENTPQEVEINLDEVGLSNEDMVNAALENAALDSKEDFEEQELEEEPLDQTLGEADADMAASLDEIMTGVSPLDEDFEKVAPPELEEEIAPSADIQLDDISLGEVSLGDTSDATPDTPSGELDSEALLDQYASQLPSEDSASESSGSQPPNGSPGQSGEYEPIPDGQYYESGKTTSEELEEQQQQGMSKSLKMKLYALAAAFTLLIVGALSLFMQPPKEETEEPYTPDEKLFPEVADVSLKPEKPSKGDESLAPKIKEVRSQPASQSTKIAGMSSNLAENAFTWTLKGQKLALRAAPELSVHLSLELQSSNPHIGRIAPQYSENMESILRNIFYFTPRNKLALPEIRTRILRELQFLMREGQIHAVQIKDFELQLDSSQ